MKAARHAPASAMNTACVGPPGSWCAALCQPHVADAIAGICDRSELSGVQTHDLSSRAVYNVDG